MLHTDFSKSLLRDEGAEFAAQGLGDGGNPTGGLRQGGESGCSELGLVAREQTMDFANALTTAPEICAPVCVTSGADAMSRQYMTFALGEEEYGIDIMAVREIKGWTDTTMIPNAPPHVRGVINLRGIVVPIFDLRARFGMGRTDATEIHVIIIVSIDTRTVGLLVDAVSSIIAVNEEAIQPVPELGLPKDGGFLEGFVGAAGGRMVALVSLKNLFGAQLA